MDRVMETGPTTVSLSAELNPYVVLPPVLEAPGGLYPIMSASFYMDQYRIKNGWPVEIPAYDIHANTLISCDGVVLTGREQPTELVTGALLRWVANDNYYSPDLLSWRPLQGDPSRVWQSSVDYMPNMVYDYAYRVGDERFTMSALNFDSDLRNHMWIDFNQYLSGAVGYTVIMVMSPNSVYGNNNEVPYNGIWGPGRATPVADDFFTEPIAAHWQSVTLQGNYFYLETEITQRTLMTPAAPSIQNTAPSFVALSLTRPTSTIYVGTGPSNVQSKSVTISNQAVPLDYGVVLGRTSGDVLHTADMALFDVGVYANVLTDAQVRDEFALLSRVYGGDS